MQDLDFDSFKKELTPEEKNSNKIILTNLFSEEELKYFIKNFKTEGCFHLFFYLLLTDLNILRPQL